MTARHLLAADLPAAAETLATAFADDSMMRWLAGDDEPAGRLDRAARGFFAPALAAGQRRGHVYGVGGNDGFDSVAVWSPPDVPMLDDADVEVLAAAYMASYGEHAIGRLIALGALTEEHHPSEPHFYLFILGAAVQGRGAGAEAIAPVLQRCDADGVGAYLESSNSRNLGFYERLGFRARWEDAPDSGGPLITGMWRDAQSGDRAS